MTYGVVLGTISIASTVQSNDLVTQDEVARKVGGDLDSPCVVVGDKLIRGPDTGRGSITGQPSSIDLEEVQVCLVDLGAVAVVATSEVVNDWAVVAIGPGRPLKVNR